ncbi:hypothetical protein CRX67_14660 [Enterobacteriaceae bacterium A-F18]|jgi:hypothetical protein|nr:hypothetical protein C9415_06545 [Kluyvera sp. Nf5]QIH64224.1 hypothetical protein CRX67_14660 [Enterobacteriaceae bacterium A-F18]BBE78636.1 hypothetical protein MRY16398_36920 [Phytobacter sp. MRY16-398]
MQAMKKLDLAMLSLVRRIFHFVLELAEALDGCHAFSLMRVMAPFKQELNELFVIDMNSRVI